MGASSIIAKDVLIKGCEVFGGFLFFFFAERIMSSIVLASVT